MPALVVSRHVLKRTRQPVEFLRVVAAAVEPFGDFEVPDLEWIVGSRWRRTVSTICCPSQRGHRMVVLTELYGGIRAASV